MENQTNNIKNYVEAIVNKSYLILDQIHESYFPFLDKSIYLSHSLEKIDKTKVAKTEFIIEQRIKHVENNCQQLLFVLSKLSETEPNKTDLTNRLNQLEAELKRIKSAFRAIQFKRQEKEHQQREQEESLTRRFTASTSDNNNSSHHQQSPNSSLMINIDEDSNDKNHSSIPSSVSSSSSLSSKMINNHHVNSKQTRSQKPLVKRVRQRYLDFSVDFPGMSKVLAKFQYSDWLLLLSMAIIFCLLFFLIIWQTSVRSV